MKGRIVRGEGDPGTKLNYNTLHYLPGNLEVCEAIMLLHKVQNSNDNAREGTGDKETPSLQPST